MIQVKIKKAKGKNTAYHRRRFAVSYFGLFIFAFLLLGRVAAQDDPPDLAPPPLRIVTQDELTRLGKEDDDLKARTKLALEMMNARLSGAEKLNVAENFDGMFRELGHFHALVENALDFLESRNKSAGKVLDNYKRLEIGLRSFVPRLETMRRAVSVRYEDYMRKLIIFVREARTRATEPMFADSVVKTKNGEL